MSPKGPALNVAVVGCGGHARLHFDMIAAEPRLRLVAVAEVDPGRRERAAAACGVPAFDDHRRLLDQVADLHVVHVTTMPAHLVAIALDCMARGLHVVVEKPPGMSSADTARLAAAARAGGGKAMVSVNRRYLPAVLAVRRRVQDAGGAVHVAATYNKPLTTLGDLARRGLIPDPVICDAIHHVDLLRWLAGAGDTAAIAVEVHAEVADGPRLGEHRHNAVVRFDTGAIGVFMGHYGVGYRIQRAEAHAADLSAYLELSAAPQVELYEARDAGGGTTAGHPVDGGLDLDAVGGAGYDEVRHFTDCILADRQPWSGLDDAVYTMRLAEAIRAGHRGRLP